MIVKYYGHNLLKQNLIRFGYKLCALCESDRYCYNFSVYAGKNDNQGASCVNLGSRIVIRVMKCVENLKTKFYHQCSTFVINKLKNKRIKNVF